MLKVGKNQRPFQQEEEKKEHTKPKRAKVAKVESEPEYFDDQRELEDLWKQVFPIGTEWDQLDLLFEYKWNFKNLEDAFEEGVEAEEIVDMKQMKMDWVPYIPFGKRGASVERLNFPNIYTKLEDEAEQNTVVDIMFPAEPPVVCEFDWEFDELEEFANELIASEELTEDTRMNLKNLSRKRFEKQRELIERLGRSLKKLERKWIKKQWLHLRT
ncbi:heat intolerant 4-like protein [Tanacetum coccineum]